MAVIENSVTRIALFRRLGAALTLPYLVNNHESLLHLAIENSAWQAADYLVDHMNLSINELDKKVLLQILDRVFKIKRWFSSKHNYPANA